MDKNRKLRKSDSKGYRWETTERNERLSLWLNFVSCVFPPLIGLAAYLLK